MNKSIFRLVSKSARENAMAKILAAPDGYVVQIGEPTRSLDQNAKLWPMLCDLSKQVDWHGFKLSTDEWKDFATATLNGQKAVPNMDGSGFLMVGGRTSTLSKAAFADLIEIIYMIGARFEVNWSEHSLDLIDENLKLRK
jgi:hypothetical protein